MNRRELLKTAGAACAVATLPVGALSASKSPAKAPEVKAELKRLNLRHTWTTTMSSSAYRDTVHVRYSREGLTGFGEGAPIQRYGITPEQAKNAIDAAHDVILNGDPRHYEKLLRQVQKKLGGDQHAALAAVDIALFDWVGKKLDTPVYGLFGLDPDDAPVTTFSIGIDTPEITKQKTLEAAPFPVLKVKVGLNTDEQTIEAIRSVTKKPLRVDANEGWTDREEAIRKINWLESQGVEFIEQPMAADRFEDIRYIRSKVHIPIFADEACTSAEAIPKLREAYDGINVKLDKAGGILESYRWIQIARSLGMKVMLGCMISSSCSCTAAAHLSPLVDYADLDGPLLIANDPYRGMLVREGKLILPKGPGLGLTLV